MAREILSIFLEQRQDLELIPAIHEKMANMFLVNTKRELINKTIGGEICKECLYLKEK